MKNLASFLLSVAFIFFVQNANASQADVQLEIIDAVVCSQMGYGDEQFNASVYLDEERTMYAPELFIEAMVKGNQRVTELTALEGFDADAVYETVVNHCEQF